MDKIIIRDLRVNAIIGIYDRERVTPQEILINVQMETDIRKAAETDDIANCVDYEKVSNLIKAHVQTAQRMTVEALADDIARICLVTPGVLAANVRVEKTQAIEGTFSVGVEIDRRNS